MNISNSWTQISSTGAVVQKHGSAPLSIAYSVASPSGDSFGLNHNTTVVYPTVTGKALWAKANSNNGVSATVEPLV